MKSHEELLRDADAILRRVNGIKRSVEKLIADIQDATTQSLTFENPHRSTLRRRPMLRVVGKPDLAETEAAAWNAHRDHQRGEP